MSYERTSKVSGKNFQNQINITVMGILKLFGRNNGATVSNKPDNLNLPDENNHDISEKIFLDNSAPEPVKIGQSGYNALKMFLDIDFNHAGYNYGYDNHTEASFKEKLDSIRHEFILAVETVIAQKKEFISNLRMHITNIGESSETDTRIAEDKIQEMNSVIDKLQREIDFAVNNGLPPVQGLVMKPLSQYRSGYLIGQRAYAEEKFFAKSTGLFN